MTVADPKPRARVKDSAASKRKRRLDPWCRSCYPTLATNCHHLLGKGDQSGDDIEVNLIPLCGSGSTGCHGALHGNPFTDLSGRRRTAQDVRRAIGLNLRIEEVLHVMERLGAEPGLEYLRRRYHVQVVALYPLTVEAA